MNFSELTDALQQVTRPELLYVGGAILMLAIILVLLIRRQPKNIVAYTTENGSVMVSRHAIIELVQTSCEQLEDVSKPLVKIKVKGQISDMAWCIVDSVDRIAGLAKLFFSELSKKGNTLYNVMPDIVSRLSDPEKGVEEEAFRLIMKYIFGLIEKDKLLESLVEKLCLRFRATRTERQWRDISFCLSLFPYSDRSLRKLSENFACWSDKLHEDNVYENIITIFGAVKKGVG